MEIADGRIKSTNHAPALPQIELSTSTWLAGRFWMEGACTMLVGRISPGMCLIDSRRNNVNENDGVTLWCGDGYNTALTVLFSLDDTES